jgi:hypothetical protein
VYTGPQAGSYLTTASLGDTSNNPYDHDGAYGIYYRFDDLEPNEKASIT